MTDHDHDLTDEAMDRRLLVAARRWQADVPAPPALPLDRLDDPLPRRTGRRLAQVAVAAAVVVVAGAIGLGALDRSSGDSGGPTTQPTSPTTHGTPVTSEVVPWKSLEARHPDIRHHVHGRVVTPYDALVATGQLPRRAHPGDVLHFVVTLESYSGVALDPCPDFDVAFGRSAFTQHALNCAQVPYRVGTVHHRVPALPAMTKVRFAMEITVPDVRGKQKVLWTIDGPQSAPGFYGIVRVVPRS